MKWIQQVVGFGIAIGALTGCEKITTNLPAYRFDDSTLSSTLDSGSQLGEVRTESDPAPTAPGVWLLTERKITWVLPSIGGGTQDQANTLTLGRWVRLGDLQNWRNPFSKVFLAEEPVIAGTRARGVLFHAVRGLINDDQSAKLCDFDFSALGPVEIAISNRHAYDPDGKPLARQTLPQSAAVSGGSTCLFDRP